MIFLLRFSLSQADDGLHTGLNIRYAHETAYAQLAHKRLHHIFNVIDVCGAFFIFAEHFLTDLAGIRNAFRHGLHNAGNLLHIFNKLLIGRLYFLHGAVNGLDMPPHLYRIFCDLIYAVTGLLYLFQRKLYELYGFLHGGRHLF